MRNSKAIGIRVNEDTLELVKIRADRRGWTRNKWVNWAVLQGLRSHRAKKNGAVKC